MTMPDDVEVAVIGAGAAGIAAARRLTGLGRGVVVLEARDRVGGRASTVPTALGKPVDLGCEWLHSADRNSWTELARSAGFALDERLPDWGTRLDRTGLAAVERDGWVRARAAYQAALAEAAHGPDRPALSLLAPDDRWVPMMDAISTWANGVPLARLSIHDQDRYDDSGINWRVLAGYGRLVAHYAQGLPIALSTPVRRIDHRGRRLRIETDRGPVVADAVILTLPSSLLAADTVAFVPPLPEKQQAASGVPLGLANKLFLALEGQLDMPDASHVLGATDRVRTGNYEIRPHGWPMVSAYFGGDLARDLEQGGLQAAAGFAVDELAGVFGSGIRARLRPLAASAWATDRWARGSYSAALPGRAEDRARLAAPVDDRIFFAGEATAPWSFSTAHGAHDSGVTAAEAAHRALGH